MSDSLSPTPIRELTERRKAAAPETHDAFMAFSRQVFAEGARTRTRSWHSMRWRTSTAADGRRPARG